MVIALFLTAMFAPVGNKVTQAVGRLFGDEPKVEITASAINSPCDQRWGVPRSGGYRPPAQDSGEALALMRDQTAFGKWAGDHDAAAMDGLDIDIFAAGPRDQTAVLTDVRIKVIERKPAIPMEPLRLPCGGPGEFSWFEVPLDVLPIGRAVSAREIYRRWPQSAVAAPNSKTRPAEHARAEKVRRLSLPMSLTQSDPEALRITGKPGSTDVRWQIELVWTIPGKEQKNSVVDWDGRPFRTAGTV
ncbi:hypothetical protein [Actinomadura sp. 7K507]|uniref:hypothetical protein n=1 Tax=Actinomadura sp. 7K507 TaxID=2530365 RepID=UPI00104BD085|nr:hypothetical protein [Actinomadura sp. 7K507]TDC90936.1 hypothetical protein E1285_13980 [Actinomadura sp. 7K507]